MFRLPLTPAVLACSLVLAPATAAIARSTAPAPALVAAGSTAMSLRGGSAAGGSAVRGGVVRQAPGDDITLSGGDDGFVMATDGLSVHVSPPPGADLAAGTTYPLAPDPDTPEAAYVEIDTEGHQLTGDTSLEVIELGVDATGISHLAADVTGPEATLQLRYDSAEAWTGLDIESVVDVGDTLLGYPAIRDAEVLVAGTAPVTFGALQVASAKPDGADVNDLFKVSYCSGVTVQPGDSCRLRLIGTPSLQGPETFDLTLADDTAVGTTRISAAVVGRADATGTYYPLPPHRLWDTRSDGDRRPLGVGATLTVQVAGEGGAPGTGVSAAVLNLTAVSPTSGGYLAAYPSGTVRPGVSSVNFSAGWTGANLVTVPVGDDGRIAVYNCCGSTHVVVDLLGFYAVDDSYRQSGAGMGSQYQPVTPTRVWDAGVNAWSSVDLVTTFDTVATPGLDDSVAALAVNVTAASPTKGGYLQTYSGAGPLPSTSTLNFTAGETSPNMTVVPVRPVPGGVGFVIRNRSGAQVRVIADIVGVYTRDVVAGLRFTPITATRIMDTRYGVGLEGKFGYRQTRSMTAPDSVTDVDTWALVANVTVVRPTRQTYLTVWDGQTSRPVTSNINLDPGDLRSASTLVPIDGDRRYSTYNYAGSVDVLFDVVGRYEAYPPSSAGAAPSGALLAPGGTRRPAAGG